MSLDESKSIVKSIDELMLSYSVHDEFKISGFCGPYRWLSNMYSLHVPIQYGDYTFKTSEALYQGLKKYEGLTADEALELFSGLTGTRAKRRARKLKVLSTQAEHLVNMSTALSAKYEFNPPLLGLLMATGEREIFELNHWHDEFWGVSKDSGLGTNFLGRLHMSIRMIATISGDCVNATQAT